MPVGTVGGMARSVVGDEVLSLRPPLAGVAEVLHARWQSHAYPAHVHDTWTLLVVDDGVIGYGLDRHAHSAWRRGVTLLPPHVVHDGRALSSTGFRKRVLYLEAETLGTDLVGAAVDQPTFDDRALRSAVSLLDRALVGRDDIEAETRLSLVAERLVWHLRRRPDPPALPAAPDVARRAREVFDADPAGSPGPGPVAAQLGVSLPHLVRSFSRAYGLPPHRYVVSRRLDLARRLLLAGMPAGQVAVEAGFHDQSHLTRHFRRLLATTPGRYRQAPPA